MVVPTVRVSLGYLRKLDGFFWVSAVDTRFTFWHTEGLNPRSPAGFHGTNRPYYRMDRFWDRDGLHGQPRFGPGLGPRNVRPYELGFRYGCPRCAGGAPLWRGKHLSRGRPHPIGQGELRLHVARVPVQILKTWKKAYLVAKVDTIHFEGQKDVTITVEFDRPFPAEVQLTIHCFIRKDVVLDPGSVHLRAAQGHPVQQRVIVRYAGHPEWQIQRVESANPCITGGARNLAGQRPGDLRPHGEPGGQRPARLLSRRTAPGHE